MSSPVRSVGYGSKDTHLLADMARVGESAAATDHTRLIAMRHWDVHMPPDKKKLLGGRFVPSVRGNVAGSLLQKKRRITIEIRQLRQPLGDEDLENPKDDDDKFYASELLNKDSPVELFENDHLASDDVVILRILEATEENGAWEDAVESGNVMKLSWKEETRYDMASAQIIQASGRNCNIKLGTDSDTRLATLLFGNISDARCFFKILDQVETLFKERSDRRARAYAEESRDRDLGRNSSDDNSRDSLNLRGIFENILGKEDDKRSESTVSTETYQNYPVDMIVEICSAANLPVGHTMTSDPFVVVNLGSQEVHRTKSISRTVNPIWNLETGSHFLIRMAAEEFFSGSSFVTFGINDADVMGRDDKIGTVSIKKEDFVKGKGRRIDYAVKTNRSNGDKRPNATLTLRYRKATKEDVEFISLFKLSQKQKKTGIFLEKAILRPEPHKIEDSEAANDSQNLSRRPSSKPDGAKMFKVKPGPCPSRENETTWMTEDEIDVETMQPSLNWIESGTGTLGKVYVEVLGMDTLPNMDTSIGGRDKTDPFACLVVEDSIVSTSVINDCLAPRFMPWTKRAFVFNVMYPSSKIHLGVFDYDPGTTNASRHEKIGKVDINLMNYLPSTEYVTQYDLHTSDGNDVFVNGSVTVRMRVEWRSERRALFAALSPPPPTYVALNEKKDFRCANYALLGEEPQQAKVTAIISYLQELQGYQEILHYIGMGILTVLLWRGHYDINFRIPRICCKRDESEPNTCCNRWTYRATIWIPLHSITAFAWGLLIVYDLNFIPSFFVFCIGWLFLATMEFVRNNPSPWKRCRSYLQLCGVLLFSHSFGSRTIEFNENLAKIEAHEHAEEVRKRERQKVSEEKKAEKERLDQQLSDIEELAEEEEVELSTKVTGTLSALNPLAVVIAPIQDILRQVCISLRVSKCVLLWRNPFVAFWIVTFSFLVAIAFAFVPWDFLIKWTIKIFVVVILGPWMKLVDWCYFRPRQKMTISEMKDEIGASFGERYIELAEQAAHQRRKKERSIKHQSMKKFMYGKFIMNVPGVKEDSFWDEATPASTARHYRGSRSVHISERKTGQRLSRVDSIVPGWPDYPSTSFDSPPDNETEISTETQPLLRSGSSSSIASYRRMSS